jgi:S-adenosyl-L-methionine hydrolase (adenosine-forming)
VSNLIGQGFGWWATIVLEVGGLELIDWWLGTLPGFGRLGESVAVKTVRKTLAAKGAVALISDFGYRDHYAGVMRGMIASIAPGAPIVDITHGVPAHNLMAGALVLRESWRFFPPRSVFVAVVDPGVGTPRRAIAVETRSGARFVGPDNGLLWMAVAQAGFKRAVELQTRKYFLPDQSSTFHGRDIFAPVAANLWNGVSLARLGPIIIDLQCMTLPDPVEDDEELIGVVIYADSFGNLISNLPRARVEALAARFPRRRLLVRIGDGVPFVLSRTYGDVPKNAPLALFGSFEMLEVAVREGNAAEVLAAAPGAEVRVRAQS